MKRKMVSILLALTMLTTMALTACGQKNDNSSEAPAESVSQENGTGKTQGEMAYRGNDISEPVVLRMYLIGDRTPDFDQVYDEINKKLQENVNATLEVDFLSWSEHDTKYSLLFSSGEKFDLIFTATGWAHYSETANMGGFYEITDEFVSTYAPDIKAVVPEDAWDQAKIGGKDYMIPCYKNEFASGGNLLVRGDLLEKYNVEEITSRQELESFLDAVCENEQGISALGTGGGEFQDLYEWRTLGFSPISGDDNKLFMYHYTDPDDVEVRYILNWDEFTNYCHKMKEMYEKRYWSADSQNSQDEKQDNFLNGKSAVMTWNPSNQLTYGRIADNEHPDWNCRMIDFAPEVAQKVYPYTNNGMAININSNHKERAMMVLNELYTNPEIYDLARLGIEGVHWEAVGDDQYKLLDKNSDYGVDANCNWGWTNEELTRTEYVENPTSLDDSYKQIMDSYGAMITHHVLDAFVFDPAPVSTEIAIISTLNDRYYTLLNMGMADDVDAVLEEFSRSLEEAGIQKVIDEMNRQVAEYIVSKN